MSRRKRTRLDSITRIPEAIAAIEDPRASRRRLRMESVVFRALSALVVEFLNDPVLASVSITRVVMSPDLRHAKVYFASGDPDFDVTAAMDEFRRARGYLRSRLAEEIRVRYVPKLHFYPDRGLYNAWTVEEVLRQIHEHEKELPESLREAPSMLSGTGTASGEVSGDGSGPQKGGDS